MLSVFSCAGGASGALRQGSPRVLSRRRRFYESYYPTPKRDTFDPKKTASHAPLLGGTTPATKTLPVARRVLGESNQTTLMTRWNYAGAICNDTTATLAELREAVNTLEEVERTARRVLGGSHPLTRTFEDHLRDTRVALAAREDVSKKLKTRRLAQKSIHRPASGQGAARHPSAARLGAQASSQPRWAAPAASVPTTRRMRNPKFGSPRRHHNNPRRRRGRKHSCPRRRRARRAAAPRPPCRVQWCRPRPRRPGGPRSRRT